MTGTVHAERLTALDTGFLVAETPRTPMHIGALVTLEKAPFADGDGRVRLDVVRRHVAERLSLVPRLRQVLRDVPLSLGRPVWVDDPDFEIEHHVRLLELPAPGDDSSLLRLTEELAMSLLDRTRPLWEWWVIDGLDDDGVPGGRLAMMVKMHHCVVDGVGGVEMLGAFTDLADVTSIDASDGAGEPSWTPRPAPSSVRLLASSTVDGFREPWFVLGAARDVVRAGRRGLGRAAGSAAMLAGMARPSALAPSLSLNRPVGHHRNLRTITLDLAAMKAVAHDHHTHLNDVVLTVVTGGLRALLVSRGEPLARQRVQAIVPENIRNDGHGPAGNRITGFFAALPVDMAEPLDVLREITAVTRRERRDHADRKVADLLASADHVPYPLVRSIATLINVQPWVNTLVTNVPGPREPLSMSGARIVSIAPLVPLSGNLTIGIAALSYGDTLTLTVNTCRDACPDVDVMVDGVRATSAALRDVRVSRRRGARPPRG